MIAVAYKLDGGVFASWLHHLSIVRNRCAHHSRVWNHSFTVTPKIPKSATSPIRDDMILGNKQLYNTLIILLYLMDYIAPGHTWCSKLKTHLVSCPLLLDNMGFPANWANRPIWN